MRALLAASVTATLVLAVAAAARTPRYVLTDLGVIGPAGQVLYVSSNGIVSGATAAADASDHAALWYGRFKIDIGARGLGGANSIAFGVNASGQAVGGAETAFADPHRADFCGFAAYGLPTSGAACQPFLWQHGVMTPLPTLGGFNGTASQINRWGTVAGEAENAAADPDCPQKLQLKPVTWEQGSVRELPTYPGDTDAVAYAINDNGQVVGSSGTCSDFNPALQLSIHPLHPMLWQRGGSPVYLGSLGGSGYGTGNLAINISNKGHVVGTSDLPGDTTSHAFLWTSETGMRDLGVLPGDSASGAIGINDSDVIVGISLDATFTPRAFVWQDGTMTDLNSLVPRIGLHLLLATSVNGNGEIVGLAVDERSGEVHGFLADPIGSTAASRRR